MIQVGHGFCCTQQFPCKGEGFKKPPPKCTCTDHPTPIHESLNQKKNVEMERIINGWNSDRPQRKTRNIMAEIKSLYTIFGRCNSANVLHDIQVIHKYISTNTNTYKRT